MPRDVVNGLVVVAVIVVCLVALVALLVMRRYLLARPVGSFDCAMRIRTPGASGSAAWAPGVARYESDRLDWFPFLGLGARPAQVMRRQGFEIVDRREADEGDVVAIEAGWVVVTCDLDAETFELAMERQAYEALATWLESAPPGQNAVFS